MYYKIDIKDEGRLDKNGTKEKKKEKEEKDTMNITVRQSRQSGVARATCPD